MSSSSIAINDLPTELIAFIISFLPLHDKLKCLDVCKRWRDIITMTNLDEKVELDDEDNTFQVLGLVEAKRHIGSRVRDLTVHVFEDVMPVLILFPDFFPNITRLKWVERRSDPDLSDYQFGRSLRNWARLERLVEENYENVLLLTIVLLANYECENLKHIEVTHSNYNDNVYSLVTLQALVKRIQNAPLLECLVIKRMPITLVDLEDLHARATRLKELRLEDVYLNHNDGGNVVVANPAIHLQSVSFEVSPSDYLDDTNVAEFQLTLINWIRYIGEKSPHIQDLGLLLKPSWQGLIVDIENQIMFSLSGKSNLTSYSVNMCPLTIKILDWMEMNNINLKKIKIWVTETDQLELETDQLELEIDQLLLLGHFSSTRNVETLKIDIYNANNSFVKDQDLQSVAGSLNSLRHLVITEGDMDLFIKVLQHMPNLESLEYCLRASENSTQDLSAIDNRTVGQSRIKRLNIACSFLFYDVQAISVLDKMNQAFNFILQSCLVLEKFTLLSLFDSDQSGGGALNLNFSDHTQLSYISIDVAYCNYYTFNEVAEEEVERWLIYNEHDKIQANPAQRQEQDAKIHINLVCPQNQTEMNLTT